MAEEISKFGIETEIITEAMTGKEIQKIDAVVLGADQILINGNVINKSGSRMLAVLAHHQDIPVYVLAASQKKVKRKIIKQDSLANKEISKQDNKLIKFRYEYFEEIEKELITKIFND